MQCECFMHFQLTSFLQSVYSDGPWHKTLWVILIFNGKHLSKSIKKTLDEGTGILFLILVLLLYLSIQFVIFKPLSYCFEETIEFDVKVSFASRSLSRPIR